MLSPTDVGAEEQGEAEERVEEDEEKREREREEFSLIMFSLGETLGIGGRGKG